MTKSLLFFSLISILLSSCAKKEEMPMERSTVSYTMDGSQLVDVSSYPDEQHATTKVDSTVSPEGFSTAPLPLRHPLAFAIGTRSGKVLLYNDRDSLINTLDLGTGSQIDQLLADSSDDFFAVTLTGDVFALSSQGKTKWHTPLQTVPRANAVFLPRLILVPSQNAVTALDRETGKMVWQQSFGLDIVSLAIDPERNECYCAISYNQAGATDSVVVINGQGQERSRFGVAGRRILSNLIVGKVDEETRLYMGVLTSGNGGPVRQSSLECYSTAGKLLLHHDLPYLVINIAANGKAVFTSGYRTLQSGLVSGIDAFSMQDTTWFWRREFTEPIGSKLAVSKGNVYFAMSFASEAYVTTRGLFYTLDAVEGRTVSERTVENAPNGFITAMPMVDQEGRFILADRNRLIVYILDRSSLRRVF